MPAPAEPTAPGEALPKPLAADGKPSLLGLDVPSLATILARLEPATNGS